MCAPSVMTCLIVNAWPRQKIYSRNIIYSVLLFQFKGFYWGFIFAKNYVALMTKRTNFWCVNECDLGFKVSGKKQGWSNLPGLFLSAVGKVQRGVHVHKFLIPVYRKVTMVLWLTSILCLLNKCHMLFIGNQLKSINLCANWLLAACPFSLNIIMWCPSWCFTAAALKSARLPPKSGAKNILEP